MSSPVRLSPHTCYRWCVSHAYGDSDDLVRHYGGGHAVADNLRENLLQLRRLYPELAAWGLIGLFWAWSGYENDFLMVTSSGAPARDERFLGYILLRSVAGFPVDPFPGGGGWDVIDQPFRRRDGKDVLPAWR